MKKFDRVMKGLEFLACRIITVATGVLVLGRTIEVSEQGGNVKISLLSVLESSPLIKWVYIVCIGIFVVNSFYYAFEGLFDK